MGCSTEARPQGDQESASHTKIIYLSSWPFQTKYKLFLFLWTLQKGTVAIFVKLGNCCNLGHESHTSSIYAANQKHFLLISMVSFSRGPKKWCFSAIGLNFAHIFS